jgi:long-chain fatty acid transport protein
MAQGLVLPGVGPVNRSMGGAAVAAPLDALGAIHWNPAAISGLPQSEMDFGVELLHPRSRLASTVAAGALAPGFPPIALAGSDEGDNGLFALPSFALVYKPEESDWSLGLGLFAVGGFGTNYPGSLTNPILTAPPPAGLGVGPIFSRLTVVQMAPTASYWLTRNLAIGFAPTVTLAELAIDPDFFASPDDANGDGFATSPAATHSRIHWGLGFQVGVFYTTDTCWHFGASFKSPQWFQTFRWNSADELGRPRTLTADFDYPMILSIGAAYSGFERLVIATDVRYIDFKNTDGLRTAGFDATGAITGLGWDSVFSIGVGAQYQVSDRLSVRGGYLYNENPVPDELTSFNIASPVIYEHGLYLGASVHVTQALKVSLAWVHAFENSIEGPIVSPLGAIPGTSVKSTLSTDSLVVGTSVLF